MAKAPRAGRVKTRLAADIGAVGAVRFYRTALAATVRRVTAPGRWRTVLAVAPDHAELAEFGPVAHVAGLRVQPQGDGDLGARLARLFAQANPGLVVVIGSDIPAVNPTLIAGAFEALAGHDVVLGPSSDGGYWLIGMRTRSIRRGMLSNVRWSTPDARADTLRAFGPRARVGLIVPLDDVDDGASFAAQGATASRVVQPLSVRKVSVRLTAFGGHKP